MYIRWGASDNGGFKLPINPESYTVDGKQQNTSVNIHGLGELNLKGKRSLLTVSWSSFFPNKRYDFAQDTYHDPVKFYVRKLLSIIEKNTTVHLIVGTRINLYGTIESFTWGENEQNGDVVYDISIKEQRMIAKNRIGINNVTGGYTIIYTWKKGDTWAKVCKKILGSSEDWKDQRKSNISIVNTAKKAAKAALKKQKKKKKKTVKENTALIGYMVVLKARGYEVVEEFTDNKA